MIMAQEQLFIKPREEFEAMLNWINQVDDEGLRIDQVERGLFSRLLAIGFELLTAYVAKFGCGDAGKTVERDDRTFTLRCRESQTPRRRGSSPGLGRSRHNTAVTFSRLALPGSCS